MNPTRKVSHPAGAPVRLYLLGAFRLEREAKLVRLATHKVESLLAYLALFPHAHSRDQLTTLLWGDSTDDRARNSLRNSLTSIRQALGDDSLLTDREAVQLNLDLPFWVDAAQVAHLMSLDLGTRDSEIEQLVSALENYAELLPDFYDEWILRERERLRTQYLDALLRLAHHHREKSEYQNAIVLAQKVLAIDRANERAYQHLMFCLAAQGDRIAALKQYDECQKALREELDIEPSPETVALREQIEQSLIGSFTEPVLLTNLPNPLTSFVGREKEMYELKGLLSSTRLLTLTGVGGSGKTRLAIQIARDKLPNYKHGIWWVDLAPLSDPALVPQTVARVLGVQESSERTPVELLRLFIRDKSMHLVLDNCEHVIGACAELAETLLLGCPHLQILATSREALNVSGETVWRVPSLASPDPDHLPPLDQLAQYDSVKLFVLRAIASSQDWKLDNNASAVAEICARLDGIPLAIELAAARVKLLKVEHIAARLNERFALLTDGSRTALPRQQTLRATVDWSHDLLPESTRKLFQRLAVFAGGWTLEAAEEVCADSHLSRTEVLHELSRLVDRSLVVVETQNEETRYRYLETIRQYAQEKLEATDEGNATRSRHLDYFLKFAKEAEPKLYRPGQIQWLDRFDIEHDNLTAALEWSLGQERVEKGLRLAADLCQFWQVRGYMNQGRAWLETLLAKGSEAPAFVRAEALTGAGFLSFSVMDIEKATAFSESALALYRELGDKIGIAYPLVWLGRSAAHQGDYARAQTLAEQALVLNRELKDRWGEAVAFYTLADIAYRQDDYGQAEAFEAEGIALAREVGNLVSAGRHLSRLGRIAHAQDNVERAVALINEGLIICWQAKDYPGIAGAFTSSAGIALARGALAQAARLLGAAETLREFRGAGGLMYYLTDYERSGADLHSRLDEATCESAWAEGRAMTLEQAVNYALENLKSTLD